MRHPRIFRREENLHPPRLPRSSLLRGETELRSLSCFGPHSVNQCDAHFARVYVSNCETLLSVEFSQPTHDEVAFAPAQSLAKPFD